MATKRIAAATPEPAAQRLPAEMAHAQELAALQAADQGPRPDGWRLSPRSVRRFILGGAEPDGGGPAIARKIHGNDALVERAIVTLAGQRGLMLVGEPGTAKSLLSELLAAAISGDSKLAVQGGAGVVEEQIRYGWNYALLLRDGPGPEALVPGPLHRAMGEGRLLRFEEITRCSTEVQDCMVPVLSERLLQIPELKHEQPWLLARPGFNVIATANLRDRGVNEMSAALKRRFNFETMRPLEGVAAQAALIGQEVGRALAQQRIGTTVAPDVLALLATAFQELRSGSVEGTAVERPGTVLSTAEAIDVAFNAACQCWYFGQEQVGPAHLARHLLGTVIKDDDEDRRRFAEYLRVVARQRAGQPQWQDFVAGGREH
ncbi:MULTISPECIES: AAA family ATPase [Delftia]|uniref:ATP-binding protein n=1 Tax=Delftia TaxID=80865 RepID=UPI00092AA39D|nr:MULTISPECIES: AAA family ATPase [Delftia]MDH0420257.1 AAA family ATPase [Delftia tsuruhatensis]OJX18751.1 MAG: AAA family ATPase [Delftia sp. 67-8]QFS65240.1 AAA domain-containing protein [Delftia tsuruhatensis]WON86812.1 AAA family ATPase [Delftia sp. UGAL515B_04]